jgi:hypothetical protein
MQLDFRGATVELNVENVLPVEICASKNKNGY